ncbi:hypothetical protein EVAR_48111_1 [Eumeta japonica]|uniref:Uncharacterized protein n=1 Tax=Eumeta variegata TaxID=151549 RepID=A0A4C1XLH6_EUMVA|nr:hypothetical protein EVAR_48111_1 [Eumeta japonica]
MFPDVGCRAGPAVTGGRGRARAPSAPLMGGVSTAGAVQERAGAPVVDGERRAGVLRQAALRAALRPRARGARRQGKLSKQSKLLVRAKTFVLRDCFEYDISVKYSGL